MCLVFVEYSIKEECRSDYLVWLEKLRSIHPELECYEGTDQPGLFVELWKGMGPEGFQAMKAQRAGAAAEGAGGCPETWKALDEWIDGGRGRIHIWSFQKVI